MRRWRNSDVRWISLRIKIWSTVWLYDQIHGKIFCKTVYAKYLVNLFSKISILYACFKFTVSICKGMTLSGHFLKDFCMEFNFNSFYSFYKDVHHILIYVFSHTVNLILQQDSFLIIVMILSIINIWVLKNKFLDMCGYDK